MHVHIVNPFDNLPIEGYRPERYWLMARRFALTGDDVTLWCADFSHALKMVRNVTVLKAAFAQRGELFKLEFVHAPPYPKNICPSRIVSHYAFARAWIKALDARMEDVARKVRAQGQADEPTLIIVSSPPLSLARMVRKWARRKEVRLIVDVMDAWPETFARIVPSFLLTPLRWVARANYRAADAVTVVAQRYLDMVRKYGVVMPCAKFYHGIECVPNVRKPRALLLPLRLVYVGNMSKSYDLATVIDGVLASEDVTLDLAGYGPDARKLQQRAAHSPKIRFHGYLSENALRALLAESDVGLVPMFPDSCVGVPYKLADYAAMGLPVINSLPGETADLLTAAHAGVSYVAGDLASFRHALTRIGSVHPIPTFAHFFDAKKIYDDYVDYAHGLCACTDLETMTGDQAK